MKDYPSHFADVRNEIEDELDSMYLDSLYLDVVIISKTKYADNLLGDYTTTWFVGHKRFAFFTAHWDDKHEQWQGSWKVFNNDIKE